MDLNLDMNLTTLSETQIKFYLMPPNTLNAKALIIWTRSTLKIRMYRIKCLK